MKVQILTAWLLFWSVVALETIKVDEDLVWVEIEGQCTDPHCIDCNPDTPDICLKCLSGYYLKQAKCAQCSGLTPHCTTCSDQPACETCEATYFLTEKKECKKCGQAIKNCVNCANETTAVCQECEPNYLLDQNRCKTCEEWVPHCLHCDNTTSPVSCLECAQFYYPSNSTCTLCSDTFPHCLECGPKDQLTESSYYELQETVCKKCQTDSYLDGSECKLCGSLIPNCDHCGHAQKTPFATQQAAVTCQSCLNGFFLSLNSCKTCLATIQECKACRQEVGYVACQSCSDGFKVSDDHLSCVKQSNTTLIVILCIIGALALAVVVLVIYRCLKRDNGIKVATDENNYEML